MNPSAQPRPSGERAKARKPVAPSPGDAAQDRRRTRQHGATPPYVRDIPDKASLKVRRKTLGWDEDYLLKALTQLPNLQAIPLTAGNGEGGHPTAKDRVSRG
jgi:hypothetical protein